MLSFPSCRGEPPSDGAIHIITQDPGSLLGGDKQVTLLCT